LSERIVEASSRASTHLQLRLPACEPAPHTFQVRGAAEHPQRLRCAAEHPQRHVEGRIELVQIPTQPLLRAATLVDEVVAVIDEQLQLPVDALVRAGPAQVRLPERCPCDRESVARLRRKEEATLGWRSGEVQTPETRAPLRSGHLCVTEGRAGTLPDAGQG
jgi:hypothetical protein